MYRVMKDKGNNQTVTLENVDTKKYINLGTLTKKIMDVLEKEVEFDGVDAIKLTDKWDFTISDEAGKNLAKTTMPMRKPVRKKAKIETQDKVNTSVVTEQPKRNKPIVDVFDMIFGMED